MSEGERYLPASDFLRMAIADEVPFLGGHFAEQNLQRLIELARDEDISNRDWAVHILSGLVVADEIRREDVSSALMAAANDPASCVRVEAACGLIELDRDLALSIVRDELRQETVISSVFYAAEDLADPSLVEDLREFQDPDKGQDEYCQARYALQACIEGNERGQTR